jgi:DHA1 family multidrug resistance protein-like MFS transporter
MTFAQSPWYLLAFNILAGMFLGGLLPMSNALIALNVPPAEQGATYGLTASAGAAGRAIAPLMGSFIAVQWGNRALFPVAAALYTLSVLWVGARIPAGQPKEPQAETVQAD